MIAQKCRGQVEINSKWDEKKKKKMEIKAEDIHKNLHIYRDKLKRKGEKRIYLLKALRVKKKKVRAIKREKTID